MTGEEKQGLIFRLRIFANDCGSRGRHGSEKIMYEAATALESMTCAQPEWQSMKTAPKEDYDRRNVE